MEEGSSATDCLTDLTEIGNRFEGIIPSYQFLITNYQLAISYFLFPITNYSITSNLSDIIYV